MVKTHFAGLLQQMSNTIAIEAPIKVPLYIDILIDITMHIVIVDSENDINSNVLFKSVVLSQQLQLTIIEINLVIICQLLPNHRI